MSERPDSDAAIRPSEHDFVRQLPPGYVIDSYGLGKWEPGPGLPLVWFPDKGNWGPPGFVQDTTDPDRCWSPTTGRNAVWDAGAKRWTDAQSGAVLGYRQ